ncbi:hypothetical protein V5R04_00460 [Jonesiaceae bacterium BS-20]|uniref:Phasin domain-containing protein n=1 Tax=Jonesiaceae bacterium BS-20 TaxID=3120821 RepID=A0AAU7DVK0_9MICO
MSFIRNFFDEIKTRKIVKEMGLYVATQQQVDGSNAQLFGNARTMTAAGNLEWFAPAFEAARESKAWTENGGRVYGQLLSCLDAQPGADRAAHLKTFETYYQQFPCPATAGMYASQLVDYAYELRGTGWAHEVGEDQSVGM